MKALCVVCLVLLAGGADAALSPILADLQEKLDTFLSNTERQHNYEATFDSIMPGIPMCDIMPLAELPSWQWLEKVFTKLKNIALAHLDAAQSEDFTESVAEIAEDVLATSLSEVLKALTAKVEETKEKMADGAAGMLEITVQIAVTTAKVKSMMDTKLPDADTAELIMNAVAKLFDILLNAYLDSDLWRPDTYEAYPKLFDSLLTYYAEPESNQEMDIDEAFGRYRVAGYVPTQLRKVSQDLLDDMKFSSYSGKSSDLIERVNKALSEGRLYGTDYAFITTLPNKDGKYAAAPVGLFEIPEDEEEGERVGVKPLCVQVNKGAPTSIFTPSDGEWAWRYAKTAFNSMEGVYHEGVGHLGHTHLVVEALLLSLKRSVPIEHPLRKLVDPHLEGTVFINWLAEKTLIGDIGIVDVLLPNEMGETRSYISGEVLERLSQNLTWPAFMEDAGLSEEQFPVKYYPYRDYAGRLWKVFYRWVERYLRLVYPTDDEMNADSALEDFRAQLVGNKVKWVEDTWTRNQGTVSLLTDIVTSIMFIGSVQHAAVNFPQGSLMSAAGVIPLSLYSIPQNLSTDYSTEQDLVDALPPIPVALLQRDIGMLLSTHYINLTSGYANPAYDTDDMVSAAKDFYADLVAEGEYQDVQNAQAVYRWQSASKSSGLDSQHWAYTQLHPSNIPMSINI